MSDDDDAAERRVTEAKERARIEDTSNAAEARIARGIAQSSADAEPPSQWMDRVLAEGEREVRDHIRTALDLLYTMPALLIDSTGLSLFAAVAQSAVVEAEVRAWADRRGVAVRTEPEPGRGPYSHTLQLSSHDEVRGTMFRVTVFVARPRPELTTV